MRRVLLISLSLVLAVVGWSTVCAQDFYVIAGVKRNYAPVPKTGQTTSYALELDDGGYQKGVPWPAPRFTDNGDGTVTDKLTRLIWMKAANALLGTWDQALSYAVTLKSGMAGLTDGSKVGDWRLPNVRELQSLIDYGMTGPALPAGHPFTNVQSSYYWSSTTYTGVTTLALYVDFSGGVVGGWDKSNLNYVWCVRGGP